VGILDDLKIQLNLLKVYLVKHWRFRFETRWNIGNITVYLDGFVEFLRLCIQMAL
jgi:hypothetical protein